MFNNNLLKVTSTLGSAIILWMSVMTWHFGFDSRNLVEDTRRRSSLMDDRDVISVCTSSKTKMDGHANKYDPTGNAITLHILTSIIVCAIIKSLGVPA